MMTAMKDDASKSMLLIRNPVLSLDRTEQVGAAVMSYTHIQELLASNPDRDTWYLDGSVSWFPSGLSGKFWDIFYIRSRLFPSKFLSIS
jgi:hypothetical protein